MLLAKQIKIFENTEITVNELIIAAINEIDIGQNALIQAVSQNINDSIPVSDINVAGDGALIRVSSGDQVSINRTDDAGTSGSINLSESSVIVSNKSIAFDVSNNISILGSVVAESGSLLFSADNLILTDSEVCN